MEDIFFETLKNSTAVVQAKFEQSRAVWHNATAGSIREQIINHVLLPYLPDSYGIANGLCYDKMGQRSKQLDLILYDKIYSHKIPMEDYMVFPCESIYGNIEVKTYLNKAEIQTSIDNINSVKVMQRDVATEFNFTPKIELRIGNEQMGTKKNNFFGAVFAYQSDSVETVLKNISASKLPTDRKKRPDIFVLFDKGTIIWKASQSQGLSIELCGDSEGYVSIFTGEYTIAFFVYYVLAVLYDSQLKSINPGLTIFEQLVNGSTKEVKVGQFIRL